MNRRNVFKAFALPFAAASTAVAATQPKSAPTKSLMEIAKEIVEARSRQEVLYVDIGNLPTKRAEAYCIEIKNRMLDNSKRIIVPVRNIPSRVETIMRSYNENDVI